MLRKWRSNFPQVLDSIPEKLQEKSDLTIREPDSSLQNHRDTMVDLARLLLYPRSQDTRRPCLKEDYHSLCSEDVRLPWLVCTSHALCQIPHSTTLADESGLPPDIQERFKAWRNELPCLKERPVPRRLVQYVSPVLSRQHHGLSDASQAGYRAIIYVRNLHSDASMPMKIMVAKAKVTPKKMVTNNKSRSELTIPCLELFSLSVDVYHRSQPENP